MALDERTRAALEKFRERRRSLAARADGISDRTDRERLLGDYLRTASDIVQSSVQWDRGPWLKSLVEIVKAGEWGVDPLDPSRSPESSGDAAIKLLAIFARMSGDPIFAEAAERFPDMEWDGERLTIDPGDEFLHRLDKACRGLFIDNRGDHDGGQFYERPACDLLALVPTSLSQSGLSFDLLGDELGRWLELGFGRVFPESVRSGEGDTDEGAAGGGGQELESVEAPQYVTLDQMAARVNRSKRALEKYLADERMPYPDVDGGGGKPNEWEWSKIRPWLEDTFGKQLPENLPDIRR